MKHFQQELTITLVMLQNFQLPASLTQQLLHSLLKLSILFTLVKVNMI